ncbi:ABC transporter substrate-binding protein [Ketogulonicigenium vulgare]|uniref:ABC transporter substrate-binding protein n=1 Tax=Ketogulonicigenium vulgare TaxID=92945 RepID=UPI0001E67E9E|nr:ABC transporter substrate-binding protein [Ketogulonicigenium vulgare]ADO41602.1 ABC transporter substrate-binding protein [Ketogulonicigenium vulgare Y25]ALJ80059.1 hypothetical protein KVH_02035 [Ketogulonicigenium vulgare]ANW32938.1 hypothetical protein KvSKV_02035 [Ketogulonicigenium vulgare]AOZ53533.1 ABC transporter substrate-binding protein [Ketogulonicigenium vulgare]
MTKSLAPTALDSNHGSAAPDGVFPRDVQHENGIAVIAAAPARIAVISTGQLDCAVTLGVVPVAATQGHGTGVFEPYLAQAFPQLARALGSLTDIGDRKAPDLDRMRDLALDLIFMNAAGDRNQVYGQMAALAPTVVTRGTGVNWKVDFLLMAHALGKAGAAQNYLQDFVRDAAAAPVTRGTVSFVQSNGRRLTVMGRRSFIGSIADDMGLTRPAAQAFEGTSQQIEASDIAKVDADWIIYAGQGAGVQMIHAMPGWKALPAVNAGRAIEVDYQPFFNNAGATAARIALTQLCNILSE